MNNTYFVKRLFEKDIDVIEKCYRDYDFLHFNPMTKGSVLSVLTAGQVWGVFSGEEIIGCTYMLAGEKQPFGSLNAAWEITDLLNRDVADLMVAGYMWIAPRHRQDGIYAACAKLWDIYATRLGKKLVLHYTPAHTYFNMGRLFSRGYALRGLRGLDRLVPHYIFTKPAGFTKTEYPMEDVKICSLSDTKEVSRLCENGLMGISLDEGEQNIIFIQGS